MNVMLLPTMSVMDWEGSYSCCLRWRPQLKDQKNVMVELDVLPAPVMPTGDPSPVSLACECDASAPTILTMDWEDVFLLGDGTSVEGSEWRGCDGAGCDFPYCVVRRMYSCQLKINLLFLLLL